MQAASNCIALYTDPKENLGSEPPSKIKKPKTTCTLINAPMNLNNMLTKCSYWTTSVTYSSMHLKNCLTSYVCHPTAYVLFTFLQETAVHIWCYLGFVYIPPRNCSTHLILHMFCLHSSTKLQYTFDTASVLFTFLQETAVHIWYIVNNNDF